MPKIKISPAWLIALLLIIFIGISLFFRVYLPYGQIFVGDEIKYASNDAYFYMRLVDNLSHHFPHLTQFDPYFLYPGGNTVTSLPTFHWITAIFAWIGGGGHPTQHTVDVIGVFLPAILGALTILPVFFIGKTLFNKWVGVFAAALIAVLPGEFLSRSMLGSGDNPVAEVFFTTTALAFLIMAIKSAMQNQLSFTHILKREWKVILKPLIYSVLAGVFLGFYLTTWQGALIFVFIILFYLIIQFIINHLNNKSSDSLCIISVFSLLPALIILILNPMSNDITLALAIAFFVPPVLYGLSKIMGKTGLKTYFYPAALAVIGVLAVVVVYYAAPDIYNMLLAKFRFVFFPTGSTAITTVEMTPMLLPAQDVYTPSVAWGNFTTSFFIAPWWPIIVIGLVAICGYLLYLNSQSRNGKSLLVFLIITAAIMIVLTVIQVPKQYQMTDDQIKLIPGIAIISFSILFYSFIRRRKEQPWYVALAWIVAILLVLSMLMLFTTYSNIRYWAVVPLAILIYILCKQSEGDEHLRFFIIWSLIILMIPMIQRRFQYYLAVNMALLSGYLAWQIIWQSGLKKLSHKPEELKEDLHISKTKMKRKAFAEKRSLRLYYVNAFLALVIVALFVFSPNISTTQGQAKIVNYALSDSWQAALVWMRDNTPDPMGDPDAYYKDYDAVPAGESFNYPTSAYGVTAWWDYGYWIIRIAHRIPSTNPSQSPDPIRKVAAFFLSQNKATADELRKVLGSKYIIADYEIATGKYWAVINWAQQDPLKYSETCVVQYGNNQLLPKTVYYPEYYRSTFVRLYNFNGKAVTSENATVITFDMIETTDGNIYKMITEAKEFSSYKVAFEYAQAAGLSNHAVVGQDPFVSCVSLEALDNFRVVYTSPSFISHKELVLLPDLHINVDTVPSIIIFEYITDN